jgi:hypothetical protein
MKRFSPLSPPVVQPSPISRTTIPDLKQWFRMDECATIFAVSNTQIWNWVQEGVLESRAIASAFDPKSPPKKIRRRVTRESVVNLLNDRSRAVV